MQDIDTERYCVSLAKSRAPDMVLASLYTPPPCRDALMALCALDAEFTHIRHAAREELIAHMRYAWWEDALEQTYAGNPPAGHVVLQAWHDVGLPLAQERILGLLHHHRSHYPQFSPEADEKLEAITHNIIDVQPPQAQRGWHKARGIIRAHREKYGAGRNSWLYLKLLLGGIK